MGMPFVLGSGPVGVRAAAAPIPPPCNDSRCLERGVAGYCGSSAASSDTYLLLSGAGLVGGGVPLLLRCRDLLYHCWPLRLIDAPSITCHTATRSRYSISFSASYSPCSDCPARIPSPRCCKYELNENFK